MTQTRLRGLTACLLALTLAWPAAVMAADDDEGGLDELQTRLGNEWVPVKNDRRRGIKTWVKQEDGKRYRSFKVEATLKGRLDDFVRTVLDFDNYPKWYWEVMDVKLLRRISATEYQLYIKHRAPHSVPNRDVPALLRIEPQSETRRVLTVTVRAIPELVPERPPFIRMKAEDMTIRVTPVGRETLLVEAEGYVDPGGKAPNWAINFIQRSAPYMIVLGVQRVMETGEFSKQKIPFPVFEFGE
ncbi:MAG TPA: hypothetical protein VFW42_09405 [Fluviicoccus sp.]|nr:hypothetical protein [Fluviicoccus sp.]